MGSSSEAFGSESMRSHDAGLASDGYNDSASMDQFSIGERQVHVLGEGTLIGADDLFHEDEDEDEAAAPALDGNPLLLSSHERRTAVKLRTGRGRGGGRGGGLWS